MSMEPTQSPSEPEVHSGEDFVHIDDPRPTGDITLSDSIVNVDKDELFEEAAEEARKNSDSFVSSGYDDGDGISGGGVDDGVERSLESTNVELPEELAKGVVILTCESSGRGGSCDVYLVGTAHVSKQSCQDVEAIIGILKPEVVFVELCSSRLSVLKPQTLKIPTMADMIESWKQKQNTFGILYGWFLAKIASHLEVFPGAEFRVAYEEAIKYGGKVILGDRPVQITLKRTWAKMPLWHKVKFLYSILFQAVFLPSAEELEKMLKDMDDVDMVTLVIQEMSKEFPTLMDTIVHERDQYMASSLLRVASEHSSVVAVIGKGHINGIKKNWMQPITMNDLMEIPSDNSIFTVKRIMSSVVIAVAGTAIVSGILFTRRR